MLRRNFMLAASTILAGLSSLPSWAVNLANSPDDSAMFAQLIKIIDQTGTIIPGRGFKSIQLGDSFKELVSKWGQPSRSDGKDTLTYMLDRHTLIHFTGEERIENIVVQGQAASLARVNNGIRFGMTQEQVLGRYNSVPNKHKADLIRYQSAGIEFWFKENTLVEVKVFIP